jgi:hypothetical protein
MESSVFGGSRLSVLDLELRSTYRLLRGRVFADTILVLIGHPPSTMEWTADDTNSLSRIHAGLPKGHI